MKWSLGLLLAACLIGNFACTGRPARPNFIALFGCGAELLSANLNDARTPEIANRLEELVAAARPSAKNPADIRLLLMYSKAAEGVRRSISRLEAESAGVPMAELHDGTPSSVDLWREATNQLKAAQQQFAFGRSLRKIEPVIMDPPMRKWPWH